MGTALRGTRPWRFAAVGAVLLLSALAAWAMNAYGLAVEMDHSRFRASDSVADARRRGVLVRLPEFQDSIFLHAGHPLRVREAWVEEATQVRYRWYLPGTRRIVRLGTHRLVADVVNADGSALLSQDYHYLTEVLCATSGPHVVARLRARGHEGPFSGTVEAEVPHRLALHSGSPPCPGR